MAAVRDGAIGKEGGSSIWSPSEANPPRPASKHVDDYTVGQVGRRSQPRGTSAPVLILFRFPHN